MSEFPAGKTKKFLLIQKRDFVYSNNELSIIPV